MSDVVPNDGVDGSGGAAPPPAEDAGPSPPRPSRRQAKRGRGGFLEVVWAMAKAVVIFLVLQFCLVHVQILLTHFGEGGVDGGDGASADETVAMEGNASAEARAAERAMSEATSAAAAVDEKRAGEAAEAGNPQDGTGGEAEKPKKEKVKKKKEKRPKKEKKPSEPKVKKPREPKPKPPPIIKKVEVIKEVKKTRKLTHLTPEQVALLDEEESKWSGEMDMLVKLVGRRLADGKGSLNVRTSLGPQAHRLARYIGEVEHTLAEVSSSRQLLDSRHGPRAARTKDQLRQAVDRYDQDAKGRMDAAASARAERRMKVQRSDHYVPDLESLLRVKFLGNFSSEELGSRFDSALREVSGLAEEPPTEPSDEENWTWDITADMGAVLETVGIKTAASGEDDECDAEIMVRQDLPPLPHVPDEEEILKLRALAAVEEEDEEEEEEDDEDEYYANAARESDLFTLVGSVESVLRDRPGRYDVTEADETDDPVGPLSTDEGEERFFDVLDELASASRDEIDRMRREAEENSLAREGCAKACVDEDDLEELVKGGLEAMYRGRDVREVLEEIVRGMYDDPERREDVRLDDGSSLPDLTDFQRDAASPPGLLAGGGASMDEAMLRRIADDPLLARLLQGLDHVVEASAGHFDPVDRVIDLLSGEGHDGSVGQTLEKAIRLRLGRLKFPNEVVEMRERAGILFDQV